MIYKFQSGGVTVPPFAVYQPLQFPGALPASGNGFGFDAAGASGASSGTKGSSDSTKGQVTEKDILSMIEKGLDGILPSDAKAIASELSTLFSGVGLSTFGAGANPFAAQTSGIAGKYISALTKLNNCKFSLKQYEKARDLVESNGGINEFAIDARGKLVCMNDKGDFKLLSPEQLKESEGYSPLTNAELLQYRALTGAFSDKITSVVSQGIGIKTVQDLIKDVVSKIGKSVTQEEGYAKTRATEILKGLQDFTKAQLDSGLYNASLDNLVKGKVITESQKSQIKSALSYIYSTLPENAKSLLKVKSLMNGGSGSTSDALNIISSLLNASEDSKQSFEMDIEESPSRNKDGSGKSSGSGNEKVTLLNAIQGGWGGHDTVWRIDKGAQKGDAGGGGFVMQIPGTAYEDVTTPDGKPIEQGSLYQMLSESGLRGISNLDSGAYFGNQRITTELMSKLAYNGGAVCRVNIPVNSDGSPNFKLLDEYEKAFNEAVLKYGPEKASEAVNKIVNESPSNYPGLSRLRNADGSFSKRAFAPYMLVDCMTTEGLINISTDNKYIRDVGLSPDLVQQLKLSLKQGTGKETVYPDIDEKGWFDSLFDGLGMSTYDHVFKGSVFIPLNMNKVSASLRGNPSMSYVDTNQTSYQQRDITVDQNAMSASLLFN